MKRASAMSAIVNGRGKKCTMNEKTNTNICVMYYVHYEVIYTLTVINDKKCLSYGLSMQKLHVHIRTFAQKWPQYRLNDFIFFCIRLFCFRNCLFCRIFLMRSLYFVGTRHCIEPILHIRICFFFCLVSFYSVGNFSFYMFTTCVYTIV